MVDIIRYLTESSVKTHRGNNYHKDTIRRILSNDKYLGIYKYADVVIYDGIPRIIDDVTFEETQILLEKNRKAPARAKAIDENYLLTTKIFCGHCNCAMTGVSGTSSTGKIHQYYNCVTQKRKGGCNKKSEQKVYIEDKVVNEVLAALTSDYIDTIARKIADLSATEGHTDTVTRLNRLLKENAEATANLVKAIETGKAVDVLSAQIEKRQAERADLEAQLAHEKLIQPILTYEEIKFFFDKFKGGDANDIAYRTALIDTFVGKIRVFDGNGDESAYLEIYCHASEQKIKCALERTKSSSKAQLAPQVGLEPTTLRLTAACSTN